MLAAPPEPATTRTPRPTLVALAAHARTVPSTAREALAQRLRALPDREDRVLVRTCHRVELYAVGDGIAGVDDLELPVGAERLDDVEAVEHLLAVACGLDSTVFGETQILHQLREALEERRRDQPLDPILDRLFQASLRAGREARSYFTGPPRSLADVALDRIEAAAGPIAGRGVLIVGAGRMARIAGFAATRRDARVLVANRTQAGAEALAHDLGATATAFDEPLLDPDLAGIVIALAGPWPIEPRHLAAATSAGATSAGATIVDLSSPPALPGAVTDSLGTSYVSVDDLAVADEGGSDQRTRARVERLVSEVGGDYCRWLRARGSVPAIRAVVDTAEERRQRELEWLRRRIPNLREEELALVEQMSHRLVASILHAPLTALGADEAGELEPAARELFGL